MATIKDVSDQLQKYYEELFVKCSECKHSMFSDFELECKKGIIGIANRDSGCIFGEKRDNNPPNHSNPSEKEYGCVVCKHCSTCEPNPFGICNEFERKKEQ